MIPTNIDPHPCTSNPRLAVLPGKNNGLGTRTVPAGDVVLMVDVTACESKAWAAAVGVGAMPPVVYALTYFISKYAFEYRPPGPTTLSLYCEQPFKISYFFARDRLTQMPVGPAPLHFGKY